MPSRNCRTRPLSWKIACNKLLSLAIKEAGWEASWVFTNIIASVDNLGRIEGGVYQLRDMFFPHFQDVKPDKIEKILEILVEKGLIIRYCVEDMWYIQLPKIGNFSIIKGNMDATSDFPSPSASVIKDWERKFNDVYTPTIPCIYGVRTEGKGKGKGKDKGKDKGYIYLDSVQKVLDHLNQKTTKQYRAISKDNQITIGSRLKEGYSVEDLKKVIDNMCEQWLGDEKMERFLRPSTLFRRSNIEGYLNADKGVAAKWKK